MLISPLLFGILTDLADIRVAFAAEPFFLAIAVVTAWIGAKWMAGPKPAVAEGFAT